MRYRVTCDLLVRAFAMIEVEASSPGEAVKKVQEETNLAEFDEPTYTEVASVEADEGEVEEVE